MKLTTLSLIIILAAALASFSQTTEFTYQGSLKDGASAANGNYDFEFKLFDLVSGGSQQGGTAQRLNVAVANGIFTVSLDFGAGTLPGADRFLDIGVRTAGGGAFTALSPRQKVNSSPYSVKSLNATSADSVAVAGVPSGSGNYIQNGTSQQPSSDFNVSGTGSANILDATTQFNINGSRILSRPGSLNLFAGVEAGRDNTTGFNNAFFGSGAGTLNTAGSQNAFFGQLAGIQNTTGNNNSFFGFDAGSSNTTGGGNTFFGSFAGESNSTGSNNTVIGLLSDVATDGLTNATAIGYRARAGESNSLVLGSISGVNGANANTDVGIGTITPRSAMEVKRNWNGSFGALTVTGDRPTIRFSSDNAVSNNQQWILHLGSSAGVVPAGSLSFFNGGSAGTSYGNPVFAVTSSNTVVVTNLGFAGSTNLCRNTSNEIAICSSSLRYKSNIAGFSPGLSFVNKLRPISFDWKDGGMNDVGFGAEDVAKIDPRFVTYNDKGEVEGVKYDRIGVVLVNAVKEQQSQIDAQQKEIAERKETEQRLQSQIDELKKIVCSLKPDADGCKHEEK